MNIMDKKIVKWETKIVYKLLITNYRLLITNIFRDSSMVEQLAVNIRSFQEKFWNENLGITVKPLFQILDSGNTVGTPFNKKGGAVETRYRDA